jgi:DNA end-binding protein Ku
VVLTNREHLIALKPLEKGLVGTLLRYPYEVRSEERHFDEIPDVKVTKDMLEVRGPVRDGAERSHQPEARRQAYCAGLTFEHTGHIICCPILSGLHHQYARIDLR